MCSCVDLNECLKTWWLKWSNKSHSYHLSSHTYPAINCELCGRTVSKSPPVCDSHYAVTYSSFSFHIFFIIISPFVCTLCRARKRWNELRLCACAYFAGSKFANSTETCELHIKSICFHIGIWILSAWKWNTQITRTFLGCCCRLLC